jgi:hypothetical protein
LLQKQSGRRRAPIEADFTARLRAAAEQGLIPSRNKDMARKVLFHQTGGDEVLQIVEVPTPEPGAGEVRLRVRALGINRSEVNLRAGSKNEQNS